MEAAIADAINRRDAVLITARLDALDLPWYKTDEGRPWCWAPMADTLLSEDEKTRADRAWLVGALAAKVPGIRFDGIPADCDWDNLFAHLRDEILARRNDVTRDPILSERQSSPCGMV